MERGVDVSSCSLSWLIKSGAAADSRCGGSITRIGENVRDERFRGERP